MANVCDVMRCLRAVAHRDADIGRRERCKIVHTIADHDNGPREIRSPHKLEFLFW
jgi:hypothetical protein